MQHRMVFALSLLTVLASAMPTRAEFAVGGMGRPNYLTLQPTEQQRPEPTDIAPKFKITEGFGKDVSLKFAAKQIVPSGVTVLFGRGVDRGSPVNWSGGRPWNRALAAAIQPLGLRMTIGTKTVTISR